MALPQFRVPEVYLSSYHCHVICLQTARLPGLSEEGAAYSGRWHFATEIHILHPPPRDPNDDA